MSLKRKASFPTIASPNADSFMFERLSMDDSPKHLSSRTRKRFRDDRPEDRVVYGECTNLPTNRQLHESSATDIPQKIHSAGYSLLSSNKIPLHHPPQTRAWSWRHPRRRRLSTRANKPCTSSFSPLKRPHFSLARATSITTPTPTLHPRISSRSAGNST